MDVDRDPRIEPSDQPISALFDSSRFQSFYSGRSGMFPVSGNARDVDVADLGLPAGIENCRAVWVHLRFPSSLVLGALGLSFDLPIADRATRSATLVGLRQRIDAERSTLRLGGDEHALGPDFHQVLMIPPTHAEEFGLDPVGEDAQRLVATKTDGVRPDFQSARMPRDANRYLGTLAAITPGASVLGGQDEHIQRACLVAAMQVIASLASLRSIFDRAYVGIHLYRSTMTAPGTARLDRERTARLAEEIRTLQLDLSFEVESQQEVRLAVPLLPVEDFHADLSLSLGVARASHTTSRMIERLAAALDADLGRLSLEEAAETAARTRRVDAWVIGLTALATVSVPITLILALLGTNVSQVAPPDGRLPSLWEARLVPYYAALILIPAAVGCAAWFASRQIFKGRRHARTSGVE